MPMPYDILSVTGSDCFVEFPNMLRQGSVAGVDDIHLVPIGTDGFEREQDGPPLILLEG